MDLYISPLSCSLAAHVACLEAGLPVTLRRVDRATKRLDDGADYLALAPLGNVPRLVAPDGAVLTEVSAVLQWIADQAPDRRLAPAWGTRERYELVAWLSLVATELHKKHLWMIFTGGTPEPVKAWARASATSTLGFVAAHLDAREFVVGDAFTVADAYLFWALLVAPHGGIALDAWPALSRYVKRMQRRDAVRAALALEVPMFGLERASA